MNHAHQSWLGGSGDADEPAMDGVILYLLPHRRACDNTPRAFYDSETPVDSVDTALVNVSTPGLSPY